jgi:hypothetical protein
MARASAENFPRTFLFVYDPPLLMQGAGADIWAVGTNA